MRDTSSAIGISRSTLRARWLNRMSRLMRPALAWLTSATGSPVQKVDDAIGLEALVGFSPAQDGQVDHQFNVPSSQVRGRESKSEVRSPKSEVRSPKSEVRNLNLKSEVRSPT